MAQSKFKTGDRVCWTFTYAGYTFTSIGTVQQDTIFPDKYLGVDEVWVLWDNDNRIIRLTENEIEHEEYVKKNVKQLSVEECLNFLISQGYNVALSK